MSDYKKPVVYFYIDENGDVVYVGKANGTIDKRIYIHSKDPKFDCENHQYTIRYQTFLYSSDMDVAEKVYIKHFKPKLNVIDNTSGFFPRIQIDINELCIYHPDETKHNKNSVCRIKPNIEIDIKTKEILNYINSYSRVRPYGGNVGIIPHDEELFWSIYHAVLKNVSIYDQCIMAGPCEGEEYLVIDCITSQCKEIKENIKFFRQLICKEDNIGARDFFVSNFSHKRPQIRTMFCREAVIL